MNQLPREDYEAQLRSVLERQDWQALRDFSREQNQIPDDIYAKDQHFWEVLMHKLTCNRIDMMGRHESSQKWLSERGYTTDLGGV